MSNLMEISGRIGITQGNLSDEQFADLQESVLRLVEADAITSNTVKQENDTTVVDYGFAYVSQSTFENFARNLVDSYKENVKFIGVELSSFERKRRNEKRVRISYSYNMNDSQNGIITQTFIDERIRGVL